ncbi:hypothetical protein MJO28_008126 [Puccinia striiformis f. sp. tritici]|uniref:Uncharacterized protein n=1 Tax=Puccinia striiformis f. sp. tritici TaxID=168172 RepID=A0ACC0E9Q8_9BASI|nr:hypothetical protein Pst134EB_016911 [Puccinia striiformis f. sp. tritici]KAI7949305.1 hypothetical protein MJO28_008126 [Puccinia striiformis f. sp. tritici]
MSLSKLLMANPYSSVTVFDAEESSRTVPADNLAFQDFSQNLQSDNSRQPPQGSVRGNVYNPDAELQQRIASSP